MKAGRFACANEPERSVLAAPGEELLKQALTRVWTSCIHEQARATGAAMGPCLFDERDVKVVWASDGQVDDVHARCYCIVEGVQKPAGVAHLHITDPSDMLSNQQ